MCFTTDLKAPGAGPKISTALERIAQIYLPYLLLFASLPKGSCSQKTADPTAGFRTPKVKNLKYFNEKLICSEWRNMLYQHWMKFVTKKFRTFDPQPHTVFWGAASVTAERRMYFAVQQFPRERHPLCWHSKHAQGRHAIVSRKCCISEVNKMTAVCVLEKGCGGRKMLVMVVQSQQVNLQS